MTNRAFIFYIIEMYSYVLTGFISGFIYGWKIDFKIDLYSSDLSFMGFERQAPQNYPFMFSEFLFSRNVSFQLILDSHD